MALRAIISMDEIVKRRVSGKNIVLTLKTGAEISVNLKDWNRNMLDARISVIAE